jgi:hypothetical protein
MCGVRCHAMAASPGFRLRRPALGLLAALGARLNDAGPIKNP